jgi:hypothetical protein
MNSWKWHDRTIINTAWPSPISVSRQTLDLKTILFWRECKLSNETTLVDINCVSRELIVTSTTWGTKLMPRIFSAPTPWWTLVDKDGASLSLSFPRIQKHFPKDIIKYIYSRKILEEKRILLQKLHSLLNLNPTVILLVFSYPLNKFTLSLSFSLSVSELDWHERMLKGVHVSRMTD